MSNRLFQGIVHQMKDAIDRTKGVIDCNVDVTELMGAEIYLYVNVGGIPITARVEPTSTAHPGDSIKVAFELDKLHIFDKETERTIINWF